MKDTSVHVRTDVYETRSTFEFLGVASPRCQAREPRMNVELERGQVGAWQGFSFVRHPTGLSRADWAQNVPHFRAGINVGRIGVIVA